MVIYHNHHKYRNIPPKSAKTSQRAISGITALYLLHDRMWLKINLFYMTLKPCNLKKTHVFVSKS